MELVNLFVKMNEMGLSPTLGVLVYLIWKIERRVTVLEIKSKSYG